jgi:hypothetical protein
MSAYADTSLLISYYILDSNSVSARGAINAMTNPLLFTGLQRLEMRNALALGVFRRVLTAAQASACLLHHRLPQPRNPCHRLFFLYIIPLQGTLWVVKSLLVL